MKLAKASQEEIDRLMSWLQAREQSDDPPPPFMRVVFGYETLLNNCADPAADVLEFKPELKAAMEDKARLDWMQARYASAVFNQHMNFYQIADTTGAHPQNLAADIGLRAAIDCARQPGN